MYELLLLCVSAVPGRGEPLCRSPAGQEALPGGRDVEQGHLFLQRGGAVLVGGPVAAVGGAAVQQVVELELGLVEDAGGVERVVLDGVGGGPGN